MSSSDRSTLIQGDCLERLRELSECSVDSLLTDPPAGISFMRKDWDHDRGGRKHWIAWMTEVMAECLRVMKPGAHGLVWALPRTSHWTATALEDAGFEIRDVVTHLFGQGFPKSLNVEKAGAGAEWSGWGTALKPASEHWILIRKPCSERTVAANVLRWGTGAINIDGSRIKGSPIAVRERTKSKLKSPSMSGICTGSRSTGVLSDVGRFPANLTLDEYAARMLDEQSGTSRATRTKGTDGRSDSNGRTMNAGLGEHNELNSYSDSGVASRFFYCAKISASERNAGFEGSRDIRSMSSARPGSPDLTGKFPDHDGREKTENYHPTVKPQKLMRYYAKLITPPGGIVLDPFMGSGSTGIAALAEGFRFIGIEKMPEYFRISEVRINAG